MKKLIIKKILGIMMLFAVAMAAFFSVDKVSNGNIDLASLIAISTANAEAALQNCAETTNPDNTCFDGNVGTNYCMFSAGATSSCWVSFP